MPVLLEASFGWGWLSDLLEEARLDVRLSNCFKAEKMRQARGAVKTNDKDAALLAPPRGRAPLGRQLGRRGNRTLKWAFIEAAHGAVRSGGGFMQDDFWVWCGSVIRGDDGRFHMFAARWPRKYPFRRGYVAYSQVVRAVSDRPQGPYHFSEVVLPARGAAFWDGRMPHNRTIHRRGQTFLLFYIGSTHARPDPSEDDLRSARCEATDEAYANTRIGLATADLVCEPWTRRDEPILTPRAGRWDNALVTNPAPCMLDDGRILMLYRANTPGGLRIGAAVAQGPHAEFMRCGDEPIERFGSDSQVEGVFLWRGPAGFELLAKDMSGNMTGQRHAGLHATSHYGVHWRLSRPPMAYSRRVRWDDGSVTLQGCLERPQLLLQGGQPTHLFAATADGPGGFERATRTWNMVLPLRGAGAAKQ